MCLPKGGAPSCCSYSHCLMLATFNDASNLSSMKHRWRFDVKCTSSTDSSISLVFNNTTTNVYGWNILRKCFHEYVAISDRNVHRHGNRFVLLLGQLAREKRKSCRFLYTRIPLSPTRSDILGSLYLGCAQPIRIRRRSKQLCIVVDFLVLFWNFNIFCKTPMHIAQNWLNQHSVFKKRSLIFLDWIHELGLKRNGGFQGARKFGSGS